MSEPGVRVGPVAILFPVAMLGSFVLFDLGVLVGGIGFFERVGHWIMGTGLMVGVIVLTVALVDLVSTMSGTPEHRARGAASSALAVMVVLFGVVWWARVDAHVDASPVVWLVELVAVAVGGAGAWFAREVGAVASQHAAPWSRLGLGDI